MSTHDTERRCTACGAVETNGDRTSACCEAPTALLIRDAHRHDGDNLDAQLERVRRTTDDAFLIADVTEILEWAGWENGGLQPGGYLLRGPETEGRPHRVVLRMKWTGLEVELHGRPVARTRLHFNLGAPAGRIARAIIALTTDEGDDV